MFSNLNIFSSSLFKSSFVYTLTQAINSAVPFLLIPILTRHLTTEDYGVVAMFGVLLSLIAPFTGLSINGAITRQYYDREKVDMPVYVTNCLLVWAVSTLIVGFTLYSLEKPVSNFASFPSKWMWAIIVVSSAQFINQITLGLWQVQVKPLQFGLYQIFQTVLNMVLSIWFIVELGQAWQGRIQAQTIACVSFAFFSMIFLYGSGWIKFRFNASYIKNALNYGIPLIPHATGFTIKSIADRIFITRMVGLSATGLYTVGFQIGSIISLLAYSFNQAYVPWLYEKLKRDIYEDKIIIVKLTYLYFAVIIGLAVILGFVAPWIFSLYLGQQFKNASVYTIWIALGFAFQGMYYMVVNYIFYTQKTYILAWVTLSTAIISITLNYFAIRYWAAMGAAYTFTGISLLTFIVVWILSHRIYPMPWNLWRH